MLEQKADFPQHPSSLAGPTSARGGKVVTFIDDQQVPRCVSKDLPAAVVASNLRCREKLLQDIRHSQVVHRRDDAWKRLPRVCVDPHTATKLECRVRVDDLEVQVELACQFDLPLPLQHRRAHHKNSTNTATEQKLFENETCLNRLSETDAISKKETDSWHRQCTDHRLKLVRMNLDRRVPVAEDRFVLDVFRLSKAI